MVLVAVLGFLHLLPMLNQLISRNAFSFNLSAMELPDELGFMDLSHHAVYGVVPAQAANLQYFNVSYNRLCGELPTGMASLFDAR